ncbi:Basic endochitinase B [Abeliophyllum distichum]|uniref:Basic endochitinase B n=1 Tax=Abeliophyllum distichum TaxID=126358 RepID=A0ABD1RBB4_9LAMI
MGAPDGPYSRGYCFKQEKVIHRIIVSQTNSGHALLSPRAMMQSVGDGHPQPWTRLPVGFVTNIINGGIECGKGSNPQVVDRIVFYRRYCDLLGVGYDPNLDCYNQRPFA